MQRLVIDTNVLVSAMISDGFPGKIVEELVMENRVELCVSAAVLEEYEDVLGREKFRKVRGFLPNAQKALAYIKENARTFLPSQRVQLLNDPDDDMFLELALEASADFLITGNTNDFTIGNIGQTPIITPAVYWQRHRP